MPGPEVTFVLAGFLKIVTIGGLTQSAPVDAIRTAAGKVSPYLMVPVGLLMCWLAKAIVDNELQESKRFMTGLVAFLVLLYFGLYRVLYRYDPSADLSTASAPRQASSSRLAQLRAQLGDRDLLAAAGGNSLALRDTRAYMKEDGSAGKLYDDLAYYEGRTRGQVAAQELSAAAGGGSGGSSTAVLDARNPVRQFQRRL